MKTQFVWMQNTDTGDGDGYVQVRGKSNSNLTNVEVVQHHPKAIDQALKRKYVFFSSVSPEVVREVRIMLQQREAELVAGGFLEDEQ